MNLTASIPGKRSKTEDFTLYADVQTTGLIPKIHAPIEIALAILNSQTRKTITEFSAIIQLKPNEMKIFDVEARKVNGITDEMIQNGTPLAEVTRKIQHVVDKYHITPQNTKCIANNTLFSLPFLNQVWSNFQLFQWFDFRTLFEYHSQIRISNPKKGRSDMAKVLGIINLPNPHSAMSSVNHLIIMHIKLLHLPQMQYIIPTYQGINMHRDLTVITPQKKSTTLTTIFQNELAGLKRGTAPWYQWTIGKMTASDVPYLFGELKKYKTLSQLLKQKLSHPEEIPEEQLKNEEKARIHFKQTFQLETRPICLQDTQREWFKVSIDGVTKCGKIIVDFIISNSTSFKFAQQGILMRAYLYKIQAQLLAYPQAEYAMAWVWNPDTKEGFAFKILKNKNLQREILSKLDAFQAKIQSHKAKKLNKKTKI